MFALNNLLCAALLLLAARFMLPACNHYAGAARARRGGRTLSAEQAVCAHAGAFVAGLAASNQHTAALLVAPLLVQVRRVAWAFPPSSRARPVVSA